MLYIFIKDMFNYIKSCVCLRYVDSLADDDDLEDLDEKISAYR